MKPTQRILFLLVLGLTLPHAHARTPAWLVTCVQALTGARAYLPHDVRGWRGLDEPSTYAGLITPQWSEWDEILRIEGRWPKGLRGTLVRLGPIGFDSLAGERKRSMIDSAGGLLREFTFTPDGARVRVRQVKTEALRAELAAGRFLYPSISTLARGRFGGMTKMQNQASLVAYPRAENYIVTDEMQRPVEVRSDDLETMGEVILDPERPNAKYLAHAKRDPTTGHWCHFALAMGRRATGHVVCLDSDGHVAWRSATLTVPSFSGGRAPLLHDWGLTENHVFLYVQPYLLSRRGLFNSFFGARPLMDGLYADPRASSKVAVFAREDASLRTLVDTGESATGWHFVNTFERADQVFLDLTVSRVDAKTWGLGESMRLPILGEPLPERPSHCFLKRLRVGLNDGRLIENSILLDDANYEFPSVAPAFSGKPHRFGYLGRCAGARPWFTGLAKYAFATSAVTSFEFSAHEFAGEPMFAPREGGVDEDDGFVLVEVYDAREKKSALAIFDARHVDEGPVARLWLSRHLPFGCHGNWFSASDQPRGTKATGRSLER